MEFGENRIIYPWPTATGGQQRCPKHSLCQRTNIKVRQKPQHLSVACGHGRAVKLPEAAAKIGAPQRYLTKIPTTPEMTAQILSRRARRVWLKGSRKLLPRE